MITITNTHCKLRSFGACSSGFLIDTCHLQEIICYGRLRGYGETP